jgi:hypothetical protein
MKIKLALTTSALVAAIGFAMPAAAQLSSGSGAGPTTAVGGLIANATSTTTSTDLNVQDSGNDNSDNSATDSGNLTISDSGNDNSDNSVNDSGNLAFALGSFNSDSSDNSTNDSNNGNDSSSIVAVQTLVATSAPLNILSLSLAASNDFSSGNNSVGGGAFAAYSGILNQGWNTGISSNAQAATNVAARGTVSFQQ